MKQPSIAELARPRRRLQALGWGFGIACAACGVGLMWASAYLISASALRPPIMTLMMVIVGVRFFALGRAFFRYIERLSSHRAAFEMLAGLRAGVFERLIPRAPVGLARMHRADLMSRFIADVDDLQDLPLRVVQPLVVTGAVCSGTVVLLAILSPGVAFVVGGSLVAAAVLGGVLPAVLQREHRGELGNVRAQGNEQLVDFVRRLPVLDAYGALDHSRAEISEQQRRAADVARRSAWREGVSQAAIVACTGVAVFGAMAVAVQELESAAFAGVMLAVLILVPISVFDVFDQVPQAIAAWQKAKAALDRVMAVTDAPMSAPDPERPVSVANAPFESLRMRRLGAGWPGADRPVVRGLEIGLVPGRRVLLMGASGAGKSTIAWTLVGFLPPAEGSFTVNGVDSTSIAGDELRRVVGLCEQIPHVFRGTIRANLQIAAPDADDGVLVEVLREVGLDAMLAARDGLETQVGEEGALLSGGEAQRLALARALLAQFPVIVVDEPTANVDPELGAELLADIMGAATRAQHHPAVLLISHDDVPAELVDERWELVDGHSVRRPAHAGG